MDPKITRAVIQAGWAIAHPWADQRVGWKGFVIIYTPQTKEELDVVFELVRSSCAYVTGSTPPLAVLRAAQIFLQSIRRKIGSAAFVVQTHRF
ncbi:luciferase domain-containing protein [Ruegeria hyattellae]|uniref:luciferase domain-containing protein n=1 Tax=Ruegeria hyattellae TaxID=3233337 RepID=UPI00404840DD